MLTQQAERVMVTVVWHCSMLSEAKGSSKHYTTKTSKRSAIWRCVWAKQRLRFDISSMAIELKGMEISECGECHQLSLCTMTMEHRLLQHHQQQTLKWARLPCPRPVPMGGTASPNPGAKQQPAPRVARRTKSSMEVDSVSPSDFIQKRPSTTTLSQPTSSRARVGGGNDGQLALSVAARAKPDRGRDDGDDEVLGNKKPKSHGFGTAQVSAITDGYKKMRADPSGVTSSTSSTPTIHNRNRQRPPPTQLSRKQHAVTARQFTQIASGEAAEDDV